MRSSSRRSSNSDELHELPERRDELGLPTVSAFNSSVASLLAEGISEEGEEVLGSGSDPSVSMGEELQPHLSLCLSHRDSQKEGAATDSSLSTLAKRSCYSLLYEQVGLDMAERAPLTNNPCPGFRQQPE
eukprot:1158505-Pelagomonas_calceolata.AAC.7